MLVGVVAVAIWIAGCGHSNSVTLPPTNDLSVSDAVEIEILPSGPALARFAVAVVGTRNVIAEFKYAEIGSSYTLVQTLASGLSTNVDFELPTWRRWDETGTVDVLLRFVGQAKLEGVHQILELPASASWLAAGTIYLMPMETEVAVGEDVRLSVLQGAPDGPLDSLNLTIDCDGPIDGGFSSRLGELYPEYGAATGAWGHRSASILPLASDPEVHAQAIPAFDYVHLVHVEVTPGYGSQGGSTPPSVAGAGLLFSVVIRYKARGQYQVSLPHLSADHYNIDRLYGTAGTPMDWRSYETFPPGVPAIITVH
jgi:hypothetical protein